MFRELYLHNQLIGYIILNYHSQYILVQLEYYDDLSLSFVMQVDYEGEYDKQMSFIILDKLIQIYLPYQGIYIDTDEIHVINKVSDLSGKISLTNHSLEYDDTPLLLKSYSDIIISKEYKNKYIQLILNKDNICISNNNDLIIINNISYNNDIPDIIECIFITLCSEYPSTINNYFTYHKEKLLTLLQYTKPQSNTSFHSEKQYIGFILKDKSFYKFIYK
jgi:hypothetical protein